MDRHLHQIFKKATLFLGALFLGWTVQAQTTNVPSDSTHHQSERNYTHQGMHHGWGHRPGGDSLATANGYHHGFRNDSTHRGFGRRGHHGEGIRYTPEQRKQLMTINKDYRQKSQDLYKQDNLTLKQYKAGLIALQKEKKDKTAALLTPQQKDEVAARRKHMEENRQVMQAAHLERLKLRLNLTDDQVSRIKAGQENLHNQVKAIHENSDLLPQQKHEQMKALLAKRNDTYKSVLTPEQYSQFEKMHQHGGFGRPGGFGHPGGPGASRDGAGSDAI